MLFKKKKFKRIVIGRKKKRKNRKFFLSKTIILTIFFIITIPGLIGFAWFYTNIIQKLPPISKIEDISFSQTTLIQDKNGLTLYKLFEENRVYVDYNQISQEMVNAIISIEDKNFWTNPGIDIKGIIRAGIYDLTNPGGLQGGSTLTQQLIKNILLTRDKRIERKLKEIVLAIKLNSYIKKQIKNKYKNLENEKIEKMVKEKILELYLNYIPFGNNAFGIEAASTTYFGTSAQHLDTLQAAILAGIPQAPTKFSPYKNKNLLMGEIIITDIEGNSVVFSGNIKQKTIEKIEKNINGSTFAFQKNTKDLLNFIKGLLDFDIKIDDKTFHVQYDNGRKDIVLARMYEDGYIDQNKLKESFIKGLNFKFKNPRIDIKAPHFVFWVIEKLKEEYGEELLLKGGLTIKTTLDYNIQKIAEQSISNQKEKLSAKGANNSAMVYLDSKNGDIIAYVGSIDYYNDEIDGKVDMIQSLRQPGSTMKPLIYTLGFIKNKFTMDTPIYDIPIKIGGNKPQNVDGKFLGLIPLKFALGYSRNIPAIKMYFSVGEEKAILEFIESIGIKSLKEIKERNPGYSYGYPLAIGAGELKMIELAEAYSHLSALGKPAKINPIQEIRTSDGSILYQKQIQEQEQKIPTGVAFLLWKMLSDKSNFPPSWRPTYTIPGLEIATKSGTTNLILKNGNKLPRDGWLATYTPSKVAVFWAGNTRGEAMNFNAYGGWLNSPTWKSFMNQLLVDGYIKNESIGSNTKEIKNIKISKISGQLSTYQTPLKLVANTYGYIHNLPKENDESIEKVSIDRLCNGKVSQYTPESEKINGFIIHPSTIVSKNRDLDDINLWWETKGIAEYSQILGNPIFMETPTEDCKEREIIAKYGKIHLKILKPKEGNNIAQSFSIWFEVNSPFTVRNIKIFLDGKESYSISINKKTMSNIKIGTVPYSTSEGAHKLKFVAYDEYGYQDSKEMEVNFVSDDNRPPYLLKNSLSAEKISDNKYKVSLAFTDDESFVSNGKIFHNGNLIHTFKTSNVISFEVNNLENIIYEVKDYYGNITKEKLSF